MIRLLSILFFISSVTLSAHANSLSRVILCKDSSQRYLTSANVTKGIITVDDSDSGEKFTLEKLVVDVTSRGNMDRIRFLNEGIYDDLPYVVFEANVDHSNKGNAVSYDDTAGGKTNYLCGPQVLFDNEK